MPEMLRLLGPIVVIVVGWFAARSEPRRSRRIWYVMFAVTSLAFAAVVVTGLTRQLEFSAFWHRWLGHALVIVHWQVAPLGIGMVFGVWWPRRGWLCAATALLLCVSFALALLSSMTGYLGPAYGHSHQESALRWFLLHQVVCPTLLGISLLPFLWIPLHARRFDMASIDDGDAST